MSGTVTVDKAGRIVLPKPLRDELNLEAGDKLELQTEGQCVTLRPLQSGPRMFKKKGIWVFRPGTPLSASTANEVLRELREQRDHDNLGRHT